MKVSFPHTDLLIEHLAQGTKVSSILFDHRIRSSMCLKVHSSIEGTLEALPTPSPKRPRQRWAFLAFASASFRTTSAFNAGSRLLLLLAHVPTCRPPWLGLFRDRHQFVELSDPILFRE